MTQNAEQFLLAELAHAAAQLARVRRLSAELLARYTAQGLTELEAYEQLAQSKAYRQLQRDEAVFQQMWLRVHRHLERHFPAATAEDTAPPPPSPSPARNVPCPCGSGVKYKRCCGSPLRQMPPIPRAA